MTTLNLPGFFFAYLLMVAPLCAFNFEADYDQCQGAAKRGKPALNVWIRPDAQSIRGMVLVMENTRQYRVATSSEMRLMLFEHQFALVYLRCGELVSQVEENPQAMLDVLDALAELTGVETFKTAPWIPFGLSSVARWTDYLLWRFPERSIAGVTWFGAVAKQETKPWAKVSPGMPYLTIAGEQEWKDDKIAPLGHWHAFMRPGILQWREKGWLASMVAAYGVGHLDYASSPFVNEPMLISFMKEWVEAAILARVPEGIPVSGEPPKLKEVKPETGVLLHPGMECLMFPQSESLFPLPLDSKEQTACPDTTIVDYTQVAPNQRNEMFWTFNQKLAHMWYRLHVGHWKSVSLQQGTLRQRQINFPRITPQITPTWRWRFSDYSVQGRTIQSMAK